MYEPSSGLDSIATIVLFTISKYTDSELSCPTSSAASTATTCIPTDHPVMSTVYGYRMGMDADESREYETPDRCLSDTLTIISNPSGTRLASAGCTISSSGASASTSNAYEA